MVNRKFTVVACLNRAYPLKIAHSRQRISIREYTIRVPQQTAKLLTVNLENIYTPYSESEKSCKEFNLEISDFNENSRVHIFVPPKDQLSNFHRLIVSFRKLFHYPGKRYQHFYE